MFPSPLGVSYFQIQNPEPVRSRQSSVSVPSRGILFPNYVITYSKHEIGKDVSVPSRGILLPNHYRDVSRSGNETVSVPSRGILFPNSITMEEDV